MLAVKVACRGACSFSSRQPRRTWNPADAGYVSSTITARVPTSCNRKSNLVTIPKFPPPPRRPQNSSAFSPVLARTTAPSAVTTSYDTTLSQARPNCRANQPIPPPSVKPPTPVCDTFPAVVARPYFCAALSSSPSSAPPCTHASLREGSTRTAFIGVRSIIRPPSGTARPAMLCPPQRTAISRPAARPNRTASATSAVVSHRAITAGRRSTIAFHTVRASSYPASPGRSIVLIGFSSSVGLSTTLTAERYSDKVQFREPNEDQFRRTAGRAPARQRRTAAPAARERDPDPDPGRSVAGRHRDAVHPGARAGPRPVPRRSRRGVSAAGRRGIPGDPCRWLHAGGGHRGRRAGDDAVRGERSAADRLPLQPAGRLPFPPRCLAPFGTPGVERDAVPQPGLYRRPRHSRAPHGARRLPEQSPRYGGRPGEHADLQRFRAGLAATADGAGRAGLPATGGRGSVRRRSARSRRVGRARGGRRPGDGVGDRRRGARAVRRGRRPGDGRSSVPDRCGRVRGDPGGAGGVGPTGDRGRLRRGVPLRPGADRRDPGSGARSSGVRRDREQDPGARAPAGGADPAGAGGGADGAGEVDGRSRVAGVRPVGVRGLRGAG